MNEQNREAKARCFEELTYNLVRAGFTVGAEENGLLPVELEGQRLCFAMNTGRIRYWKEDAADDIRSTALDKADVITRTTAEYMMICSPLSSFRVFLVLSTLWGAYHFLCRSS